MTNLRDSLYENFPDPNKKIEELVDQVSDSINKVETLSGLNENKLSYTYFPNGDVQTITEKDKNDMVISITTFVYKTNGDVDTSTLAKDGVTITTQYIYDTNGNLTDTISTKV